MSEGNQNEYNFHIGVRIVLSKEARLYEGKVKLVSFSLNFKSHVLLDLIEVGFVPSPG